MVHNKKDHVLNKVHGTITRVSDNTLGQTEAEKNCDKTMAAGFSNHLMSGS